MNIVNFIIKFGFIFYSMFIITSLKNAFFSLVYIRSFFIFILKAMLFYLNQIDGLQI